MKTSLTSFEQAFQILDHSYAENVPPKLSTLIDQEVSLVKTAASEQADRSIVELKRGGAELETFVRENPLLVAGGVVAVGVAIGLFISHSRKSQERKSRVRPELNPEFADEGYL